jgi:GNAT superfamily N-acetyltransferase
MKYVIENYNPLEWNESDRKWFGDNIRPFWSQGNNKKYLLHSGVMFTEKQVKEWDESFNPDGKEYLFIREEDTVIALAIIFKESIDNFSIDALVVDEKHQRKGLGSKLMNKIEEKALHLGFLAIETEVYADNQPMLLNVISKGFKPIKIDYHRRFDGEDLIVLKKYLTKN